MTRLRDFDEFLKKRKHAQETDASARQEALTTARKQLDPLIRDLFQLTKEFHERIILPRTDSILVLKKREDIRKQQSLLYRANLIPTDFLPPAFRQTDIIERVDYLNPKEVTDNDWHANVAFQVTVLLSVNNTSTPELVVTTNTWGHVESESSALPTHPMTLKRESDKRTPYTTITLSSQHLPTDQTLTAYENLLMLLTPHVLNHRQTVWKK